MTENTPKIVVWALRIIALVMAILAIVFTIIHAATQELDELLLGIGLLALVCSTFIKLKE